MVVNGWSLFAHPLFLDQLETLTAAVERAKARDPGTYQTSANAKLLAALQDLVFKTIPADPARPVYRQGSTLGADRKHWFRAKFGGQRFRLFFRYGTREKIIIFAWVNDASSLRTYGSRTDAYAVFKGMLDGGNPPDDWTVLMGEASSKTSRMRLESARNTDA